MMFEGGLNWDKFFQEHKKFVKKLEEQLEFGSRQEQQEAMMAYDMLQQEINKALEKGLESCMMTRSELEKKSNEEEQQKLTPNIDEHMREYEQSIRKLKSLIRKRSKQWKRENDA